MLFMVVEHFKDRDPAPVYKRFSEQGRLMPEALSYVNSWVEVGMDRCFQVMETDDAALLQQCIKKNYSLPGF